VRTNRVAFGALTGGVVLKDHARSVQGNDRVDVVRIPRVVVARDHVL
jgi:hypothetical protein